MLRADPRRLHGPAEEAPGLGHLDPGTERAATVGAHGDQAHLPAGEVGRVCAGTRRPPRPGGAICSVCSKSVIAGRSFALARPEIVTVRAVAPVDVMLLGPPRVERDGAAVAFDTRKAVALLAVLALADRPRPRDVLAELLWPEHDAEHARGALRRTLSALRSRGRRRLRGRDARPASRLVRSAGLRGRRRPLPGRRGRRPGGRRRRACSAATSSRASGCATRPRSRTGSAPRPTGCGASWRWCWRGWSRRRATWRWRAAGSSSTRCTSRRTAR